MNLLVTGGYGFIASNFINYYFKQNKNAKIVNIDAMYYCAKRENVNIDIRNSPRYTEIIGNIQSMDLVAHILKTYNITHIIHFAAQSHVQNSFDDSLQYTLDNILGTHTLLEACKRWGKIQKFVHVSTDEVYGESQITDSSKMDETSILCPTNPYAATKAGAELIAKSYYHSFGIPIVITRGNNVYGPNQYPEKLIPRFIKLLRKNKKVTIQGDGSCVRSFLHVYDVVKAFELILDNGVIGEIYNIGGDDTHEYSVMEIAKILIDKIKGGDLNEWIEYVKDRPFNDQRYYISNDKVCALGWEPVIELEEGLMTIL